MKDAIVALSLANLLLFGLWAEILPGSLHHYQLSAPPARSVYGAVVTLVAAGAVVMWWGANVARRIGTGWALRAMRLAFLLAFVVALNVLRRSTDVHVSTVLGPLASGLGPLTAIGAAGALVPFAPRRWISNLTHLAAGILLAASPSVGVTFGKAAWALLSPATAFASFVPTTRTAPTPGGTAAPHRVVWIIFDELDERLAFVQRPTDVHLPELDRLETESLSAVEAYPPTGETIRSLPSLLTGKVVAKAVPAGADDLRIAFAAEPGTVSWKDSPSVFSRVAKMGMTSAVAGWYHPYCRVMGQYLEHCVFGGWRELPPMTAVETLAYESMEAINALPGARGAQLAHDLRRTFWPSYGTRRRAYEIGRYQEILAAGIADAIDPSIALTFVHMPIPRPGGIYDRRKGELAWSGTRTYLDNLALADRSLGEFRRAMEEAGLWSSTTLIVSSDHWYRTNQWKPASTSEDGRATGGTIDKHIPFIVKLAGQRTGLRYGDRLDTVVTQDMVLALLPGKLRDVGDVAEWLRAHPGPSEEPF